MTAFSYAGPGSEPRSARLGVGYQSEAWCPGEDTSEQYLQIDLGATHNITHVATQGRHATGGSCWVTQYNMSHSLNGSSWDMYMEDETVKVITGTRLYNLDHIALCEVFGSNMHGKLMLISCPIE